jgi:MFS family permease
MTAGQLAMVALMTMTPVHMRTHDHSLTAVGVVLTAHMVGMFALAPLSGRLADRFGARAAILAGVAVLLACAAVVVLPAARSEVPYLTVALFLLGYGWNLTFVGGSTMLTQALTAPQRLRVQGGVDALVWSISAVASVGGGVILARLSYPVLGAISGLVAILPVPFLLARRSRDAQPRTLVGPQS